MLLFWDQRPVKQVGYCARLKQIIRVPRPNQIKSMEMPKPHTLLNPTLYLCLFCSTCKVPGTRKGILWSEKYRFYPILLHSEKWHNHMLISVMSFISRSHCSFITDTNSTRANDYPVYSFSKNIKQVLMKLGMLFVTWIQHEFYCYFKSRQLSRTSKVHSIHMSYHYSDMLWLWYALLGYKPSTFVPSWTFYCLSLSWTFHCLPLSS